MTNLTLLTIIGIILFMSRGIAGPIGSLYTESLGADYTTIGVLGTVTSATSILFSYIWGQRSDRQGKRKRFLAGGLAVLTIGTGLKAIVPNYIYLFPIHFINAVAQAAYTVVSLALVGDLLEKRAGSRGRRMGTYRGLCSLGFGVLAFFSGAVADRLGLNTTFALSAGLLAIAFTLSLLVQESPEPAGTTVKNKQKTSALPENPPTLPLSPLLVSAFLWALTFGAVYAVWANYMVGEQGFGQAQMSRLWALASTSELPLMILAGRLSDRIGRLPVLSLGFFAWTVVFLGYVTVPVLPWIIVIQLIRGFGYSAVTATSMAYATEIRAKAERGRMSGLYTTVGSFGTILGSAAGGWLAQMAGTRTMILINAILVFACALYLAFTAIQHRKQNHES